MSILVFPQAILSQPTCHVNFTDMDSSCIAQMVTQMTMAMKQAGGIGLAANQVGLNHCIFIMQLDEAQPLRVFINPQITAHSQEAKSFEEGCLSFPGIRLTKSRPARIVLQWQDMKGIMHQEEFNGLAAVCVQHEIDHLNGITFIDDLSPLKRQMIGKKLNKYKLNQP